MSYDMNFTDSFGNINVGHFSVDLKRVQGIFHTETLGRNEILCTLYSWKMAVAVVALSL